MARIYVVSGSASGIGAVTTKALRDGGAEVIGIDLQDAEVEADLSTSEGRQQAARQAIALASGKIDAVIACAGISAPVAKTIAVNFFGVTELLTALRPAMIGSEAPRAAVVSSMSSLQRNSPALVEACLSGDERQALEIAAELAADEGSGGLIYPSSKRALSRWIRRESITDRWAGAGIPLNAVGPGVVRTPMTAPLLSDPKWAGVIAEQVPAPLNGYQNPEVIAHVLLWLTSVENTHMAGQTVYADSGADVALRGEDIWSWADAATSTEK